MGDGARLSHFRVEFIAAFWPHSLPCCLLQSPRINPSRGDIGETKRLAVGTRRWTSSNKNAPGLQVVAETTSMSQSRSGNERLALDNVAHRAALSGPRLAPDRLGEVSDFPVLVSPPIGSGK